MESANKQCLAKLKLERQSEIAKLYIRWFFFWLIVKCPYNKVKILWWATFVIEKSLLLIYINAHLNSSETVPLKVEVYELT